MRSFVAVADAAGFSAAARKTGRSKALLSKYVRELEEELGVRLLNRTTRQLSLTEAGASYYRELSEILERIDHLQARVQEQTGDVRGVLRVTAPRSFSDGPLGDAILGFSVREPDISLDLRLDDRFVDVVEEGFDVAIRISDLADSSLIARKLAPFRIVICARPDVIAQWGRPMLPADLAERPCIIDANVGQRFSWPFRVDGRRQTVTVSGRIEVNSPVVSVNAACAGLGFVRVPLLVAQDHIDAGRLETVLEDYELDQLGIYAVYPHRQLLAPKVRAFVDHLAEVCQKDTRLNPR